MLSLTIYIDSRFVRTSRSIVQYLQSKTSYTFITFCDLTVKKFMIKVMPFILVHRNKGFF